MRLRKLALAVGLASALSAEMASALGLGEIKLLSTLNQPLEAEIKLLQANDLSENEILIGLAANEDFQRAGIDRLYFLTDLKFSVVLDGPNAPFIKVSSRKPVREPYLNFLLETQWPNGRILREYTLLMDLPVFSDESVRPVQSARTSTPRSSTPPAPKRSVPKAQPAEPAERASAPKRQEPQPRRSSQSQSSQYGAEVYGPVGSNDTLWEIALKVRPNRGYSVQQTMLAIQRLNPEAFINGNINLLRKGQVLRVPNAGDIDTVTERQAVSEVAQQNNQWSGSARAGEGAQLEGAKRRTPSRSESQSVSGRLKVAGAESRENLQAGRAAGEVGGDVESLQNDLAISLEELDKSRRDNSELKDRVLELEDQIQTMERLLAVSSQELRAMQLGIKSNEDKLSEDVDSESSDSAMTADDTAAVALDGSDESSSIVDDGLTDSQSEAALTESTPAVVAPKKVDPSKVVRSAKPKEPSMMDVVMDNILYIAGAFVALLAGVFLLARRRKEDQDEEAIFEQEEPLLAESNDSDDDLSSVFDEPEQELDSVADDVGDEVELDIDEVVSTESQTGDAVGEADIYIAYGKFDQAEEMLLSALEENGQDFAARLKLMEVYVETQALDKFDQQYSAVQASGNGDAIARAADLREQFDDAPAYIAMSEGVAETTTSDDLDLLGDSSLDADDSESFDFDLGEDSPSLDDESTLSTDADSELSLDEDFGLSFESNLTGDKQVESEDTEEFTLDVDESVESELDEGLGLDLDLDLDTDSSGKTDYSLDFEEDSADKAGESDFSLDLDDTSLDGPGDITLDLDSGANEKSDEFDLDLDLDEGDSNELELDSGLEAESAEPEGESDDFGGFDLSLDEAAKDTDGSFDFDLSEESAEPLDDLDLAAEDLDADLASLDAELNDELPVESAEADSEASSENAFDLSLEDEAEDSFDVDMGDIDLDALDQEVDALSADLDVSGVIDSDGVSESPLADDGEFDLQLDTDLELGADDELSLESPEEVPTLGEPTDELSVTDEPDVDLDLDIPTLGGEPAGMEEPEQQLPEPEFDLAADLGLSAEDFDVDSESSEEEVFTEALSDLPMPEDVMAGEEMTDEDLDAELDFLADTDEAATKLDLARAYIDMGDQDGAKDILDEVVQEGNDEQKQQAQELLTRMS